MRLGVGAFATTVQISSYPRNSGRDVLVMEAVQLAEKDPPPTEFYREFLMRVVAGLGAPAAAVWTRTPNEDLQLQFQINLKEVRSHYKVGNYYDEDNWNSHEELLQHVCRQGRPLILPPVSGYPGPPNPTSYAVLVAPIVIDQQVAGLVEVWQNAWHKPEALADSLDFMVRLAKVGSSYTGNWQRRHLVGRYQALQAELTTAKDQLHRLRRQVGAVQREDAEAAAKRDGFRKEAAKASQQVEALQKQLTATVADLQAARQALELSNPTTAKERIEALQQELREAIAQRDRSCQAATAAKERVTAMQEELAEAQVHRERMRYEAAKANEGLVLLQKERTEDLAQRDRLRKEVLTAAEQIRSLQEQLAKARGNQQAEPEELPVEAAEPAPMKQLAVELEQARVEKEQLRQECKTLRQQLAALEAQLCQFKEIAVARESCPPPAPAGNNPQVSESVADALRAAGTQFADVLAVWEEANESAAESRYSSPANVFRALKALAEVGRDYFAAQQGGPPLGPLDRAIGSRVPFKYAAGESQTTLSRFGTERIFHHRDQSRQMVRHLTIGGGNRDKCLQIYFDFDDESRRVLIGYCGRHLTYYRQRT